MYRKQMVKIMLVLSLVPLVFLGKSDEVQAEVSYPSSGVVRFEKSSKFFGGNPQLPSTKGDDPVIGGLRGLLPQTSEKQEQLVGILIGLVVLMSGVILIFSRRKEQE